MHLKAAITVLVAFAFFSTAAQEPENKLTTFIKRLVVLASPIKREDGPQFGGLFFYELLENTQDPFSFHPVPSNPDGSLPINAADRFAPNLNLLNNYLVAAPQRHGSRNARHVENFLLKRQGDNLINNYTAKHNNNPPEYALVYTYYSPCNNFASVIVNFANNHKELNLTLAYTAPYPNTNVSLNLDLIRKAGVAVVELDACQGPAATGKRSADIAACQLSTLQGCLLQMVGDLCCLRKMSDKVAFINDFAVGCYPDYSQNCSDSFLEDRLPSCQSELSRLQSDFYHLVGSCSLHAVANPLQASTLNHDTGKLVCANCLQPPPRSCGVKQLTACGRGDGVCTTTAGNSICRGDHYCGYHGEPYSWCYVGEGEGVRWDYCCLGACKMNTEQDAWMCYAGEERADDPEAEGTEVYRFCGDAGSRTVKGAACRPDHPCGTHNGTSHFWCFTHTAEDATATWDYCCRPDQVCGKGEETFDWCYVGPTRTKIACNATREADCEKDPFSEGSCKGDTNATDAAIAVVHQGTTQAVLLGLLLLAVLTGSVLTVLRLSSKI